MSDLRPFPGWRPRPDRVADVASPPYDVLNSEEARAMAAGNPDSFLRVIKAEIDLDPSIDTHSDEVYRRSADNFRRLQTTGVLIQDPAPCFYLYELRMGDHKQLGIVAGTSVQEYADDLILKHEHTRRDKEDDRARHVEVLKANAGPVLLTYRARDEIRELTSAICRRDEATYDFDAGDGVHHRLWVVSDAEDVSALRRAFGQVDALYVADGHHRSASARRVRDIMRDANSDHTGEEPYNHFLAVLFPDDELRIMGYNRVLRDLNGLSSDDFLAKVRENFDIEETDSGRPDGPLQFGMFLDGRWLKLSAREGSFDANDPVAGLDVAILQNNLLGPVLGIEDPRSDKRIDFVGGIRGTGELEKRCAEDMRVGFALHPVSVDQLMAIADNHEVMPPKSTWFEPKLRSGIVVRSLVKSANSETA